MHPPAAPPAFDAWLAGLRDGQTRRRLVLRLRKAQLGNLGDVRPVGDGVFEMREHFGPGWRLYYVQRGAELIIMLREDADQRIARARRRRLARQR